MSKEARNKSPPLNSSEISLLSRLSGELGNETSKRHLVWHGMVLFLLGLFSGIGESYFANVRMGLSAHLVGILNGTFLLALGAVWTEIHLSNQQKSIAYIAAIYGTYSNWVFTILAAILGTGALCPITAHGHSAELWKELTVTIGLLTCGVAIFLSAALILFGLGGDAKSIGRT
jgi:hydroxylaminobenzene mutase